MDSPRALVYATVAVIALVTVASGPLVGAYTVPERGTGDVAPGTGNATVSVVSVPETVTLARGGYDTDVYYLEVPDATLDVSDVSGKPILAYKVNVEGLRSKSSVYFLTPSQEGRLSISLSRESLAPEEVTRAQYNGSIRLVLRGESGERVLYEEPVTVEVTE